MGTFLLLAVYSELGSFLTEVVKHVHHLQTTSSSVRSQNHLLKSFRAHKSSADHLQAVERVLHQKMSSNSSDM